MNTATDMNVKNLLLVPFLRQMTTGANQALYIFGALYIALGEWRALDGSVDLVGVIMFGFLALAFYLMIVVGVFMMTPVFTLLKRRAEMPGPVQAVASPIPAYRGTEAAPRA